VLAAAPSYSWLDGLLNSLEFCIKRGWWSRGILSSDRQQFHGATSELQVAEHFLLSGAEIEPQPKRATGLADLRVVLGDVEAIVEMVAPIEWPALNSVFSAVGDALKNLDAPYDFCGDVTLRQLDRFDADGLLLRLNPIVLEKQLAHSTIAQDIVAETAARLIAGKPFQRDSPVSELNLRVSVDFPDVERSQNGPARSVTFQGPTRSGYPPEAVFDHILDKVRKKAQQQQAGDASTGATRLLVVDISTSEISNELPCDWYRERFAQMFQTRLEPLVGIDYDGIALVEPRAWGEQVILHNLIYDDERLKRATAERFFALAPAAGALA
jgi:hypothetical protein